MEIFPGDANVLVFDTCPFVCVVGRGEIFAEVEGSFRVGRPLLDVLRRRGGVFSVVDKGALGQLTGEFVESALRLFDVYAAGSGWDRGEVFDTVHRERRDKVWETLHVC